MAAHGSEEKIAIEALENRVRELEARVRVQSKGALGATTVIAGIALLGATTVVAPDVLSARTFQLVDARGSIVGQWVSGPGNAVRLEALGARGELIAAIELAGTEPYARVLGAGGKHAPASQVIHGSPSEGDAAHKGEGRGAEDDGKGEGEEDDAFDWVE